MKKKHLEMYAWKYIFFLSILCYTFVYAPYGINETDGGFLTGLAWQVLNGKVLYRDIIYVRPPLPVFLRAAELYLLPDKYAVLFGNILFYVKVGLYSYLGAAVLAQGKRLWQVAAYSFIVSVHCYPATSWHTVDGILFAVLGVWLMTREHLLPTLPYLLATVSIFAALMCKQSFYPMAAVWAFLLFLVNDKKVQIVSVIGFIAINILFFSVLYQYQAIDGFIGLTSGAGSSSDILQHGIIDFFRLNPIKAAVLAVPLLLTIYPVFFDFLKKFELRANGKHISLTWLLFLFALPILFAADVYKNQHFTAPFTESRVLFWMGVWVFLQLFLSENFSFLNINLLKTSGIDLKWRMFALLSISWCAAISWGYNMPILFSTPGVFAAFWLTDKLMDSQRTVKILTFVYFCVILSVFRFGYGFIYRDGVRAEMTEHLGNVFPALSGIYSTKETHGKYKELSSFSTKYAGKIQVLPAFPMAHFLCKTSPILPLDWVVKREMGGKESQVLSAFWVSGAVVLFDKSFEAELTTNPELSLTKSVLENLNLIEETPYFKVYQ